jgi:hypothetical protein
MLATPDDSLTTTDCMESVMAIGHYSADSALPPPPRLVFEFRSDVTGSSTAFVPDRGTTTAGTPFPSTPSSIG